MKLKTVSAAKSKRIICDGCSKLEIAVTRKLVFNELGDSVYMCDSCFNKLRKAVALGAVDTNGVERSGTLQEAQYPEATK